MLYIIFIILGLFIFISIGFFFTYMYIINSVIKIKIIKINKIIDNFFNIFIISPNPKISIRKKNKNITAILKKVCYNVWELIL